MDIGYNNYSNQNYCYYYGIIIINSLAAFEIENFLLNEKNKKVENNENSVNNLFKIASKHVDSSYNNSLEIQEKYFGI